MTEVEPDGARDCATALARPGLPLAALGWRSGTGLAIVCCAAFAAPLGSAAADPPGPAALSVSARPVRRMCFEDRLEVTGTVVPRQEVSIGPDRDGLQVAQVLVEPLDAVMPGQVLARLTPVDAEGNGTGPAVAVRSSVAGTVESSAALPGMPATPRQPLFRIIVEGTLDLQAELPSDDLARITSGQAVAVRPLGTAELAGSVAAVDSGVDPGSQLGRLRIAIAGQNALRVGTFARGVIVVGRRCGLGVPTSAVLYPPDGTIVQTLAGDRVETRRVGVGLLSGTEVEILTGLKDGDVVVTRAGAFLRDGDEVRPILAADQPVPAAK